MFFLCESCLVVCDTALRSGYEADRLLRLKAGEACVRFVSRACVCMERWSIVNYLNLKSRRKRVE